MIEDDPIIVIRDLLAAEWTPANTVLADTPRIHTGWYDEGSASPQVTVTNPNEFTAGGGATGHSAGTGAGGVAQARVGTILVNCWAGSRADTAGAGDGGTDVNPKEASYSMAREVHRIAQESATGTLTDAGARELNSIGADDVRRIVDTDADPVSYRHEVTVRYTYVVKT